MFFLMDSLTNFDFTLAEMSRLSDNKMSILSNQTIAKEKFPQTKFRVVKKFKKTYILQLILDRVYFNLEFYLKTCYKDIYIIAKIGGLQKLISFNAKNKSTLNSRESAGKKHSVALGYRWRISASHIEYVRKRLSEYLAIRMIAGC